MLHCESVQVLCSLELPTTFKVHPVSFQEYCNRSCQECYTCCNGLACCDGISEMALEHRVKVKWHSTKQVETRICKMNLITDTAGKTRG